jgi:uncharacterized lipoprotein YehR (DUF1307 family)
MKAYSIIVLSVFLSIALSGCIKDNADTPKDYVAAISDKTWSGAITYSGDSTQYYTVHFNADKTLLWTQFSGDYLGNWALVDKQLSMTFAGNNVIVKADISDDDKLANIVVENTNAYMINSGARLVNPTMALENTDWNGSAFLVVSRSPYQMSFLPGNNVQVKINNTPYLLSPYTRSASGASIRFVSPFGIKLFGVIMSSTEINGSLAQTYNPWRTIKQ